MFVWILISSIALLCFDLGHVWIFDLVAVFAFLFTVNLMLFVWNFPDFWKAVQLYREARKEKVSVSE